MTVAAPFDGLLGGVNFQRGEDGSFMHDVQTSHKHTSVSLLPSPPPSSLLRPPPPPPPHQFPSAPRASVWLPEIRFSETRDTQQRRCLIHQNWNVGLSPQETWSVSSQGALDRRVRTHTHTRTHSYIHKYNNTGLHVQHISTPPVSQTNRMKKPTESDPTTRILLTRIRTSCFS